MLKKSVFIPVPSFHDSTSRSNLGLKTLIPHSPMPKTNTKPNKLQWKCDCILLTKKNQIADVQLIDYHVVRAFYQVTFSKKIKIKINKGAPNRE